VPDLRHLMVNAPLLQRCPRLAPTVAVAFAPASLVRARSARHPSLVHLRSTGRVPRLPHGETVGLADTRSHG